MSRAATQSSVIGARESDEADRLMRRFAERTGLDSANAPRRYLWTDAFAVCNELALWRATGETRHRALALELIDQVHSVLGRHRPDDLRRGWLSGLAEPEGALHPTRGGLRIGKPLPERPPDSPFDERLEWERDGQYFHYLTRWMHALDQTARATGDARFNVWARELADVAYRAFTRAGAGRRGMVWKLSIDLSRPLVASMGQHDPLDGLVTCLQLRATAGRLSDASPAPTLDAALAGFARLIEPRSLATADPLGLGGLLVHAAHVAQLRAQGDLMDTELLDVLLSAAAQGLAHFERHNDLDEPPEQRLAFRELGLALGIAALPPLAQALEAASGLAGSARLAARLAALAPFAALGRRILDFWRDASRRANRSWVEHADINDVMLASALVPGGVLELEPIAGR